MVGEDAEETKLLEESFDEASAYIRGFDWCYAIRESYLGLGVGGVVSVFLLHIDAAIGVDDWLWVVCGDLPSAYFVTDRAGTPAAALEVYCELMDAWVAAARSGKDDPVFPVPVARTAESALMLEERIAFLRSEVIPAFT